MFGKSQDEASYDMRYNVSFASLGNEEVYLDVWKGIDRRDELATWLDGKMEQVRKAMSLGGSGANLVPVYVDPQIVDLTRKATPLVELIPRVANRGKTVDFNRITYLGAQGFKAEDASLSDVDDTYARVSAAIKYLYQTGRVTGPQVAASAEYIDALSQEVLMKTKMMRYIEEAALLNSVQAGTYSSYVPWNSMGYDGLIAQIASTSAGGTVYTGADSNTTNKLGTELVIKDLRTTITQSRNKGGEPKLIVGPWEAIDKIKGLLMAYQRYLDTTRLAWGIETASFDGIPMIGSRFLTSSGHGFTDSFSGAYLSPLQDADLLFLDTDVIEMRVLQDIVFERLAKTADADKFYLKLYEAIICKAPEFQGLIRNFSIT